MKIPNYSIVPVGPMTRRSRLYPWLHKHAPEWLNCWVRRHSPSICPWVVVVEQQSGCFHFRAVTRKLALQQLAHYLEQGRVARLHYDWIAVALGWIL